MKRVLTAVVLAPLAVFLIFSPNFWLLQVMVSFFAVVCALEFRNLIGHFRFEKPGVAALGIGLCLLLLPLPYAFPVLLVGTLLLLSLMLRAGDMRQTLPSAGAGMLGVLYVFGSWKTALLLARINPHWLLLALAINWVGDTAAFLVGRLIGRHKLAPVISPGKSWEGAAGSLVISVAAAVAYIHWFSPETSTGFAVLIAAFANVAGQVGDLAESALKRGAGVKDSGTMLPGHGGWLDRLDSSLFSMPVVYTALLTADYLLKLR
jgi:phosphatidate cytidylyltransferase